MTLFRDLPYVNDGQFVAYFEMDQQKQIYCLENAYSKLVWLDLVSLFNGMSTVVSYLTPNPSFYKNRSGII